MTETGNLISRIREFINTGAGRWVAGVVVVGLVAVGVLVAYSYRGGRESEIEQVHSLTQQLPLLCKACDYTGKMRVPRRQKFPMDCPTCGKQQLIVGIKCLGRGCRKIFEKPTQLVFRCPHCGYYYDDRDPGGEGPDMVPKPPKE